MKVGTGSKARLIDAHSGFWVEYVDKYPASILSPKGYKLSPTKHR
jgi:hypothetical protein